MKARVGAALWLVWGGLIAVGILSALYAGAGAIALIGAFGAAIALLRWKVPGVMLSVAGAGATAAALLAVPAIDRACRYEATIGGESRCLRYEDVSAIPALACAAVAVVAVAIYLSGRRSRPR